MGWRVGIGLGLVSDDTVAMISLFAFDGRCVRNDLRSTDQCHQRRLSTGAVVFLQLLRKLSHCEHNET